MLYMEDWQVRVPEAYFLGFQGDHLAERIEVCAPLPEGWDLKADVEREGRKNVIQLEREGDLFSAWLTAEMLGEDGNYFLQLRGSDGNVVRHSNVFLAMVCHSINAEQSFPPVLPSEFQQMEQKLTALNQHPPKMGEGVWLIWNVETGAYEPSQIPCSAGIISQEIGSIQVMDQADYDALEQKNAGTLYLIRG